MLSIVKDKLQVIRCTVSNYKVDRLRYAVVTAYEECIMLTVDLSTAERKCDEISRSFVLDMTTGKTVYSEREYGYEV